MVIKPREVNGWKRIGEQAKCGGELNVEAGDQAAAHKQSNKATGVNKRTG